MSFFPSSSVIIYGGTFTSISLPTQDDGAGGFLFPFQALFIIDGIDLITAAAPTQVLGKRKDRDSCEETLDGLMVCLQTTIVVLFHDHAFVIDHKERRIRPE